MSKAIPLILCASLGVVLAGCNRNPLMVKRSQCPAVAIPNYAGTLTRFDPADSRDADAIALSAAIVDVQGVCDEESATIATTVTYKVRAERRDASAAQDIDLPVFVALVQGGDVLVSKERSGVTLHFAAGQKRAEGAGGARSFVERSATTLPADIQQRLTQKRKPNQRQALVDPTSDPKVRAAVRAASFEVLVGFQLDDPSLAYNIAK